MFCERYAGNVLFPLWGRLVALTGGNAGPGADDGSVYGIWPACRKVFCGNSTPRREILFAGQPFQAPENYLRNAELDLEGRKGQYNMIDGIVNNDPPVRADLTDGQTHEEIRELAPETLPNEKPSIMGKNCGRTARRMRPWFSAFPRRKGGFKA